MGKKYTSLLTGLLWIHDEQPWMGPNAIFDPTTFPTPFTHPLSFPVQFWGNAIIGLNNYFVTFLLYTPYSQLRKKEAIWREFRSLPQTHLPTSEHLAHMLCLPSHYHDWTEGLLSKANASARKNPISSISLQYQHNCSITPSSHLIFLHDHPIFLTLHSSSSRPTSLLPFTELFPLSPFFSWPQSSWTYFPITPPKLFLYRSSITFRLPSPLVNSQSSSYLTLATFDSLSLPSL